MYVRSSMSTVSDGYGCPHYHLHHRRANTLLVTLTLRSSLTGPLAPISNPKGMCERGGYPAAGRILRRSDCGRWPNSATSPMSRPGIYRAMLLVDSIWLVSPKTIGCRAVVRPDECGVPFG